MIFHMEVLVIPGIPWRSLLFWFYITCHLYTNHFETLHTLKINVLWKFQLFNVCRQNVGVVENSQFWSSKNCFLEVDPDLLYCSSSSFNMNINAQAIKNITQILLCRFAELEVCKISFNVEQKGECFLLLVQKQLDNFRLLPRNSTI